MAPTRALFLLVLLLCCIRGVVHSAAQLHAPSHLLPLQSALHGCLQAEYNSSVRFSLAMPQSGKASSIRVLGMWWSAAIPSVPLTLTTQLSMSRMDQLAALCASWHGPLSAVVYSLSQKTTSSAAVDTVAGLFRKAEAARLCQLDVLLVEDTGDAAGFPNATFLYPVNILRNWARLQARTPFIGLLDVDMLVSRALYRDLRSPNSSLRMIAPPTRALLVVPAFQVFLPATNAAGAGARLQRTNALVARLVAQRKEGLRPYWNRVLRRFNPGFSGHWPTNYSHWFTASAPYEVNHTLNYEPWVLADRFSVPWYDTRFRSFGLNKVSQLHVAAAAGFRFFVHPHAFIIHREHAITPMAVNFRNSRKWKVGIGQIHRYNARLYDQMRLQLKRGAYNATLDPGTVRCRQTLSWWASAPKSDG
eukprot:EG_transcript_7687